MSISKPGDITIFNYNPVAELIKVKQNTSTVLKFTNT